jgi:hypothetical protein
MISERHNLKHPDRYRKNFAVEENGDASTSSAPVAAKDEETWEWDGREWRRVS